MKSNNLKSKLVQGEIFMELKCKNFISMSTKFMVL